MQHISTFAKPQNLSAQATQPQNEAKRAFVAACNKTFLELYAIFPSSAKTTFTNQEATAAFKRQLVELMRDLKIDNEEKLATLVRLARHSDSPFFPSIAQLGQWYKEHKKTQAHFESLRIAEQKRKADLLRIEATTFEERQKLAKAQLQEMRKMLKKCS